MGTLAGGSSSSGSGSDGSRAPLSRLGEAAARRGTERWGGVSTGSRANGLRERDDLEGTKLGAARLHVAVASVERLGRGLADCRVEMKRLVAEFAGAILESKKDLTAEPASLEARMNAHPLDLTLPGAGLAQRADGDDVAVHPAH